MRLNGSTQPRWKGRVMFGRVGRRSRLAAVCSVAAVLLGGGGLLTASAAGSANASSFVPITPCRLLDTRPAFAVGSRITPLGPGETFTAAAWLTNGTCIIRVDRR